MKYQQRKEELNYLKKIFKSIKLNTISFPGSDSAPFEGQAEIKWFHNGTKAICGYGYRSTLKSFKTVAVLKAEFHILNLAIFPFMEQATQLVRASPTQSSAELFEFLV